MQIEEFSRWKMTLCRSITVNQWIWWISFLYTFIEAALCYPLYVLSTFILELQDIVLFEPSVV